VGFYGVWLPREVVEPPSQEALKKHVGVARRDMVSGQSGAGLGDLRKLFQPHWFYAVEEKSLVVTKAAGTWRTKQGTTAVSCLFMPKFTATQSGYPFLGKY